MKNLLRLFAFLVLFSTLQPVLGNGIVVNSVSLQGQNITNQTWQVQFNLTWNNSWRDGVNYDAAWIVIKFRVNNGQWRHATLRQVGFVTGTGTGTELRIAPDSIGAIANRNSSGAGTYAVTGMQLQWHYGVSGVLNTDLPQVRVIAMEMVQIPQGPFAIGDGNGSSESQSALGVADNNYYVVTTELSPPLRADGNFTTGNNITRIDGDGGVDNDGDGVIDNTGFPVGYNSFFMMKYEITQEQYADFLSMIISSQAAARFMGQYNQFRNRITLSGGSYFTDRPDRSCNFLSWMDGCAYADWAGLRPFTETEYEKACRGPIAPVLNELAWGSTSISPPFNGTGQGNMLTVNGTEDGTEVASSTANNVYLMYGTSCWNTLYANDGTVVAGPVRVGLFAENGSTRSTAGSSYYGVMDLSGNMSEQMVCITNSTGRIFNGLHGNGVITTGGSPGCADVANWPGLSGGAVTGASGAGIKWTDNLTLVGGCSTGSLPGNNLSYQAISFRSQNESGQTSRSLFTGFRCARTQWW